MQQAKTERARPNNFPPSPRTTMPRITRWENIAPVIIPMPRILPYIAVRGIINNIAVISSSTPNKILPQGSTPNCENIYTLSGCAVNLKYKVCTKMIAATNDASLSIMNVLFFMVIYVADMIEGLRFGMLGYRHPVREADILPLVTKQRNKIAILCMN